MPSGTRSNGDADLILTGRARDHDGPRQAGGGGPRRVGRPRFRRGRGRRHPCDGGFRDGNHRSRRFDRRSRVQRHARPHGPGRAENPTSVAGRRTVHPRRSRPHFEARCRCARRGVDRHHARRHTSLLLRRAGDSGGRPHAHASGTRYRRARQSGLYRRRVRELGCAARIHGSQQPCAGTQWH